MGEHILIVEDDDAIRNSIHEFLTKSDYNAFSASSAEEALEENKIRHYSNCHNRYLLPGKDGVSTTSQIKQNRDIDVIVMTGYSDIIQMKKQSIRCQRSCSNRFVLRNCC